MDKKKKSIFTSIFILLAIIIKIVMQSIGVENISIQVIDIGLVLITIATFY